LLNQSGTSIEMARIPPAGLADLVEIVARGEINQTTAKSVLSEMFMTGKDAETIVGERGLRQISDSQAIARLVEEVLADHPRQVDDYLAGKQTISRWLFGQAMRAAGGRANPQLLQRELERQLNTRRQS
jgi:aspartyl-tRNA(Asn)/glutamyl-tRNA(Gln) amidotransferase subunit B